MPYAPNPSSTYVDSADPTVRMVWEMKLNREVARTGPLLNPQLGIMGKKPSNGIQIKDQLSKSAGDTIRTTMIFPLRGRGRGPGERLADHSEGQTAATFDVKIEKLRHGVSVQDEMTDQFVTYNALDEAVEALAPWFERRYNFVMTAHATGMDMITDDVFRGNNVIRGMHPQHLLRPNNRVSGETLTVADGISHAFIQRVALQMKSTLHRMRPLRLSGDNKPTFLWFISPQQVSEMYDTDSVFFAAMLGALQNNPLSANPLFSDRTIGRWGPFTFIEHDLLPPAVHSSTNELIPNTTRGFILGAQGIFMSHGRGRRPAGYSLKSRYQLIPGSEDFGDIRQMGAKTIYGVSRPGYKDPRENGVAGQTERELGIMCVETYAGAGDNALHDSVYEEWVTAGGILQTSGFPAP